MWATGFDVMFQGSYTEKKIYEWQIIIYYLKKKNFPTGMHSINQKLQ